MVFHAFEPFEEFEGFEPFEEFEGFSDLTDDELAEADAQACWALEIQSQVALMNHRNNR